MTPPAQSPTAPLCYTFRAKQPRSAWQSKGRRTSPFLFTLLTGSRVAWQQIPQCLDSWHCAADFTQPAGLLSSLVAHHSFPGMVCDTKPLSLVWQNERWVEGWWKVIISISSNPSSIHALVADIDFSDAEIRNPLLDMLQSRCLRLEKASCLTCNDSDQSAEGE
jgi:hypothetical protein